MKTPSKMLIAVIAVFALTAFVAFSSGPSREDFEPVTVTVHTGDTPWTIAERYCPDSMDIRDYLRLCAAEIRSLAREVNSSHFSLASVADRIASA